MDSDNTSINKNNNTLKLGDYSIISNKYSNNILNQIKLNNTINGSLYSNKYNQNSLTNLKEKIEEDFSSMNKPNTGISDKSTNKNKLSNKPEKQNKTNTFENFNNTNARKFQGHNVHSEDDNQINQENEIIIVIIRHGERADLAGGEIKFDLYDPELTSKGIKQAYEAGSRLKEILDLLKPNDKKIAILTSPFSRCIMTAKYVKNGMNYNLPLFIENGLCEFINRQWFKDSPKNFLCYLKYNNLLFQELSNEIIIENSVMGLPEFPESTNKCTDRFDKAFDLIIDKYAFKTGFNVVVLVTHFFGIQSLCEKMHIPLDNFDIEYCSTFVFKFNKDNKEFKFENNFYPIDEEIY